MQVVTGANGFLGAHLCASLLLAGKTVRACRRQGSSLAQFNQILEWRLGSEMALVQNLTWHTADVLDYDALLDAFSGAERVYHCAAVVSFWPKRRDELFQVNVDGTANVVNACLELKIPKLLHVSSTAAIGRSGKGDKITEETPWTDSKNNSQYSISKYLAEMEVWRGQEEGLDVAIVNPGIILGEGDWNKGSCRFFKMIMDGSSYYTRGMNGYVDVLDVADALIKLSDSPIKGERFILVAENLRVKDFLAMVAQKMNKPAPKKEAKPWMLQLAWRVLALKARLDKKEPLITRETARTSLNTYTYSNQKVKTYLKLDLRSIASCVDRVIRQNN